MLFWSAAAVLVYTYLGYPLLIGAWAALRPWPTRRGSVEPSVSVVIVAHDEGPRIEERLQNLLALDYPRDRLEIVLASDGSTDDTARAAARVSGGVTVFEFPERRGKAAVLNDVVPRARGEIVVLGDARQRFDLGVVRALVRPFADPQVGAVSGELMLTESRLEGSTVGQGVGLYWRYEKFVRVSESKVDSTVGATGAIYAIRKELFEPLSPDTLLDDVLVPLRLTRGGRRVIFERSAVAFDRPAATAAEEFTRKVRTIAGNFQLFARERWLVDPRQNRLWLQTVSHKVMRLASPLFLVAAFGFAALLLHRPTYRFLFAAQLTFYAAALGGYAFRNGRRKFAVLSVPYVFCLLNFATAVAFFRFWSGSQAVTWERA